MSLARCARRAVLLGVVSLTGCGLFQSVHYVRDDPNGGVIAIPTDTNVWPTHYRNRAEALMKEKCPQGFVIDKVEKVVLNQNDDDGRKPPERWEYDGALVKVKDEQSEYHITFHAAVLQQAIGGPPKPLPAPIPPTSALLPPPTPLLSPPPPAPAPAPEPMLTPPKGFMIPPPPARPVMPADEPTLPAPRKLPDPGSVSPGSPAP